MIYRSTALAIYHRPIDVQIYWFIDWQIHQSGDLPQIHRSSDLSIDPLIYRSTDLQIYWSMDLQIHRSTDPSTYRSTDLQIQRSTDLQIYWFIDLQIHRSSDLLQVNRSSDLTTGSFENEALENEDRSTKHPKLENEDP